MTRYRIDIDAARRRLAAREHHTIQTPDGAVQYAERGQGPPVLFSHPLAGGFDVGRQLGAEARHQPLVLDKQMPPTSPRKNARPTPGRRGSGW